MAKKGTTRRKPDLETILRRLNPNVPAGETHESMPRIPRDSDAMRQIQAHVGADPFAKMLLTGHIGVGKSTELFHLAREMESKRWVIRCSVADTLGVHNVNAFSLLVMLLEASLSSWEKRSWEKGIGGLPLGLEEELARHLGDSVSGKHEMATRGPFRSLIPELMPGARVSRSRERVEGGRSRLTGLCREALERLAVRSVSVEQTGALDLSPLATSCELVLKELEHAAGRPVLLVVDDLDKVRDEMARDDVFLNRAMAWLRLPCGIVSTLPLDALFSSRGRDLDQVWPDVQVLDPLPVPAARGYRGYDVALEPYLRMLLFVDAEEQFSEVQCRRLANASSGLPRAFVSACATCVARAIDGRKTHVSDLHVDLVLRDIANRWRGRLVDSDYRALVDVLDSEGSNVPNALPLLRDGVLIRYGGASPERQFRLASWAEPLVEAYRRRMLGKGATTS